MRGKWQPRHVVAIVFAIAFALAPVGVMAASGQFVNIADPSGTGDNKLAKVVQSRLRVDDEPNTAFQAVVHLQNYYSTLQTYIVLGPTAATLAVSHIRQTNEVSNTLPWGTYMWYVPGTTPGQCQANLGGAGTRRVIDTSIPAGSTVTEDFADSLYLAPIPPATAWCLVATAAPATSNTSGNLSWVSVSISGGVVRGSFTPPPNPLGADRGGTAADPAG